MFQPSSRAIGVLIATLAVSSCDGSNTTAPPITPTPPYFQMSVGALTVTPGTSATASVDIVRRGNFAGEVVLAVADSMPGLTVSFDPATISGTRGVVIVSADATVPDGHYTSTIIASSDGVPTFTAKLSVYVKTPFADWYVVANPPQLTVVRGGSGNIELDVMTGPYWFPGGVKFSLVNPPDGIVADFEYYYIDFDFSADMRISVAAAVSAGKYELTLAADGGPRIPTKTIPIGLTVKDP